MSTKQVTLVSMATSLIIILVVIALLWLTGIVKAGPLSQTASVPQLINYQGRLTDAAGNPLTGTYNMTFCLYDVATGGTSLWCESQTVNVTYGVFNALLGSVNPISSSAFNGQNLYLGVRVGSDSEMSPRKRVVSAGYAFKADNGVPSGAIVLWDGAGCPQGWTRMAELDGKFLVGGLGYSPAAGGSNTHTHSAGSYVAPSHTHTGSTASAGTSDRKWVDDNSGGDDYWVSGVNHSHQLTINASDSLAIAGTSASADSRPEFATVLLCKKD